MSKLNGKVAVITGGSSGIGLATAKLFVEQGAYVFITGRRQSELDKAKADGRHRDECRLRRTRTARSLVARAFRQDLQHERPWRVLHRPEGSAPDDAWRSIVLVSSGMHMKGIPAYGTYSATKAALRSFTRTWAMELKDRGIRVNNLSPGPIDTHIIDAQFKTKEEADGARAMFAQKTPLGRLGRPEEMAAAALFLASSDSSFSTGIDLVADGRIIQL